MIAYIPNGTFNADEIKMLFSSVQWAEDIPAETLCKAMNNASHYVIARSDDRLVGYIRSMDDNTWSANIDCVIVHKDFQRMSIASFMIEVLLNEIKHIKYVSVSPNELTVTPLYTKNGFVRIEGGSLFQINQWIK